MDIHISQRCLLGQQKENVIPASAAVPDNDFQIRGTCFLVNRNMS